MAQDWIYYEDLTMDDNQGFKDKNVKFILDKALKGEDISKKEAEYILKLKDPEDIEGVFSAARRIREMYFSNKIFFYGFIYFTTYCRNKCAFCFYRKPNKKSPRYRKSFEDVVRLSKNLESSGVHLVDLTMGEDPLIHEEQNYAELVRLVEKVRDAVNVPIMVSPGVVPRKILTALYDAGADWYACYQETHNRVLYSKLRLNQDYDRRMRVKLLAKQEGMLIEEGILVGVGESLQDISDSIYQMKELKAHQVRAMGFVPQPGTPMENQPRPARLNELLTIAVMRLVHRDRLIPASLDIEGLEGLRSRLMAGANVVTSIIPPEGELVGVAQHHLDIRGGKRTIEGVKPCLKDLNLKVAALEDYSSWVRENKMSLVERM
jgi:methylornithine synthase